MTVSRSECGSAVAIGSWRGTRLMPYPTVRLMGPMGYASLRTAASCSLVRMALTGGGRGGRPEGVETWEEALHREIMEEACARINSAHLLVLSRGACLAGPEQGQVLVRPI